MLVHCHVAVGKCYSDFQFCIFSLLLVLASTFLDQCSWNAPTSYLIKFAKPSFFLKVIKRRYGNRITSFFLSINMTVFIKFGVGVHTVVTDISLNFSANRKYRFFIMLNCVHPLLMLLYSCWIRCSVYIFLHLQFSYLHHILKFDPLWMLKAKIFNLSLRRSKSSLHDWLPVIAHFLRRLHFSSVHICWPIFVKFETGIPYQICKTKFISKENRNERRACMPTAFVHSIHK